MGGVRRPLAALLLISKSGSEIPAAGGSGGGLSPRWLERDDFSSNRHPALGYCWSMIFSENRYPARIKSGPGFFGIML